MNENTLDDNIHPTDSVYQSLIDWWESRRLQYNMIVGLVGLIFSLLLAFGGISGAGVISLITTAITYAIFCNIAFCLGWFIDICLHYWFKKQWPSGVKVVLYIVGVLISIFPIIIVGLVIPMGPMAN